MSQNDNDHDVRDESMRKTTRRGLLAGVGLAGLGLFGSGGASANLSGGPEADAMAEHRVPKYRVPESELDSPGVVGREVTITSGGATYETGDQLVDLGDRWELVSPNYGSVSAVESHSKEVPVYDVTQYGATPDDTTTSDKAAINAAFDAAEANGGGVIFFPAGEYTILENTDGQVFDRTGDNLVVRGVGPASQLRVAPKANRDTTEDDGTYRGIYLFKFTGDNCGIENILIDSQWRQQNTPIGKSHDGHNVLFKNNRSWMVNTISTGSTGDGVEPHDKSVIANNHFFDNWENHIHFWGNENLAVNNVMDTEVSTAAFQTYVASGEEIREVVAVNNTIINTQSQAAVLDGGAGEMYDCVFAHNVIRDHTGSNAAIQVGGTRVIVEGNSLFNVSGSAAIQVSGGTGHQIKDNTVAYATDRGIQVFGADGNVEVSGNWIIEPNTAGNGVAGLHARYPFGAAVNTFIQDNKVISEETPYAEYAINVDVDDGITIDDLLIEDNEAIGSWGTAAASVAKGNLPTVWADNRGAAWKSGTATVSAGSTLNVNTAGGIAGSTALTEAHEVDADISFAADPGANAGIDFRPFWNNTNKEVQIRLEETAGNASVDIDWVIHKRG